MFNIWGFGQSNQQSDRQSNERGETSADLPFGDEYVGTVTKFGEGKYVTVAATLGFIGSIIAAPVVALSAAMGDEGESHPEIVEKHIFVSFAPENEADGQKVIKVLLDHGMRIYRRSGHNGDINHDMCWGVDRAAALIALCSKEYESSKECSKILNYGRQRKVPLIHVLLDVSFRPARWLEALLSGSRDLSASDCFHNTEEVLLALKEVCPEPFSSLIRRYHEGHIEELAPETDEEALFKGGCVTGTYSENQAQFSMTIEYFTLRNGRVIGHGEDESGIFTICGEYAEGQQQVSWVKKYVEGNSLYYTGQYRCEQDAICVDGKWGLNVHEKSEKFSFKITREPQEVAGKERETFYRTSMSTLQEHVGTVMKFGEGKFVTITATLGFMGAMLAAPLAALSAGDADDQNEMQLKHIFVSFAPENESDGQKVIDVLLDHGMRIYRRSDQNGDINQDMCWGVDRAAALVVLCSKEYQNSKECSKILNYGRQRKVPLICVHLDVSFCPTAWLAELLSDSRDLSASDCFHNTQEVLLALKEVCTEPFSCLIRRFQEGHIEQLAPELDANPLYKGGRAKGSYTDNQEKFEIDFEYCTLRNGRVIGHGEDASGVFTLCGVYDEDDLEVSWENKYVSGSSIYFSGQYSCEKRAICVNGKWGRIQHDEVGEFNLKMGNERPDALDLDSINLEMSDVASRSSTNSKRSGKSGYESPSFAKRALLGMQSFREPGKVVSVTASLGFVRNFGALLSKPGNHDESKHVFISFAPENKAEGRKLSKVISESGIRVYRRDEQEGDFNQDVAWGVDRAAAFFVLCSKEYQCSRECSKLLNYAYQKRVPLIYIRLDPTFRPTSWLATLLINSWDVSDMDCFDNSEAIMKVLKEVCQQPIANLVRRFHKGHIEETTPEVSDDVLFKGGSVSGSCTQSKEVRTMNLDYFTMVNGRVIGHGEDDMGAFTICGAYDEVQRKIAWEKLYVDGSVHYYAGLFTSEKEVICVKGKWGPLGQEGNEEFTLKMMQEVKKDKVELQGRWAKQMPTGRASNMRSQMQRATAPVIEEPRVVILYHKAQRTIAQRICYALNASGIQAVCPPFDVNEMMFEIASFLGPVCPILSTAFKKSVECEKMLTFAHFLGVSITPVSVEENFTLKNWLAVICSDKTITWIDEKADESIFKTQITELASVLNQRLCADTVNRSIVFKGTEVRGYYQQSEYRFCLLFPFFALVNGVVAGHGNDMIGPFVVIGSYSNEEIEFRIQYLRKGSIHYTGAFDKKIQVVTIRGTWKVERNEGKFRLDLPLEAGASRQRRHVMLSYDRYHRPVVAQVAENLKSHGIKVWFGPDCSAPNSVNSTMAVGVKDAAVVVCFASHSYVASVKCKKELTYANHMCRPIVLVRLDDVGFERDSWLGAIVSSLNLNAIDCSQPEIAPAALEVLLSLLKGKVPNDLNNSVQLHEDVLFDGGFVSGFYMFKAMRFNIHFKYLTMRDGHVVGHGDDEVGPFIVAGTYTDERDVSFVRQYIGQYQIRYEGRLIQQEKGNFVMNGKWGFGPYEEEFSVFGTRSVES